MIDPRVEISLAYPRNTETGIMVDRSNFWQMVDRTKPSRLRVFGDSELADCLDYFAEIQSDSNLPPNESLTASERLTLIRSEMDLRHADARHRRTQRLASWAIAVGLMSIVAAVTSGVAQYFIHKPRANSWPVAESPVFDTPRPIESPTATPAITATPQSTAPGLVVAPTVPTVATPTPKPTASEQRRKKRRARPETKTKTNRASIEEILRSLVRPKPTPKPDRR
jgi:hypothetical protein